MLGYSQRQATILAGIVATDTKGRGRLRNDYQVSGRAGKNCLRQEMLSEPHSKLCPACVAPGEVVPCVVLQSLVFICADQTNRRETGESTKFNVFQKESVPGLLSLGSNCNRVTFLRHTRTILSTLLWSHC